MEDRFNYARYYNCVVIQIERTLVQDQFTWCTNYDWNWCKQKVGLTALRTDWMGINKNGPTRNSFNAFTIAPCEYKSQVSFASLQKESVVWLLWSTYAENKDGWISIKEALQWRMAYLHTFGYRKCSEHVHWLREVTCETTQACISSFLKHQGDTFLSGEFGIWRSYFHSKAFLKVKFNVLKRFLNVICRNNEIRSDWF